MTTIKYYIGRFNPFHLGHAYVLERALKTSAHVVVLVGSSFIARTDKNPFQYHDRKTMIQSWYDKLVEGSTEKLASLDIVPIRDFPDSNSMWIKNTSSEMKQAFLRWCGKSMIDPSKLEVRHMLTGSDRDSSTWYLEAFPQLELDLVEVYNRPPDYSVSATSVRKILYAGDPQATVFTDEELTGLSAKLPITSVEFLVKFIGAGKLSDLRAESQFMHRYLNDTKKELHYPIPPEGLDKQLLRQYLNRFLEQNNITHQVVEAGWKKFGPKFITADAVVIQSGHVLVVRRGALPGKGLIALPGGHLSDDERLKRAAVREVMEETGILLTTGKRAEEITEAMLMGSVRAKEIFDEPGRSARKRTVTVAFLLRLDDTKPLPAVSGQNVPFYESGGQSIVETSEAFWMPLDQAIDQSDIWFEDHHSILSWAVGQIDNDR